MNAPTQSSGCGFLLAILIGMLSIFGISLPKIEDAVRSVIPRQVTPTYVSEEAQMPFTLQNDQIIYTYAKTLDRPCNYLIQGRILDAEGKPVTNVLINLQLIEPEILTPLPPYRGYPAWSADRSDPFLWGFLLTRSRTPYWVWLTDEAGNSVSRMISVKPQDCAHNVANLIFVQTENMP